MPREIYDIDLGEVSFCAKGMNQHAKVVLFKSAEKEVGMADKEKMPPFGDKDEEEKMHGKDKDKDKDKGMGERRKMDGGMVALAAAALDVLDADSARLKALDAALEKASITVGGTAEAPVLTLPMAKGDDFVEIMDEMVRKSDLTPVMKKMHDQMVEMQKAEADRQLRERAVGITKNLTGTDDGKAALVKAVEGIGDEALRKEATRILTAANDSSGALFKTLSKRGGAAAPEGTAIAKMQAIATELRKADPNMSEAAARSKARKDNPELYKEEQAERADAYAN